MEKILKTGIKRETGRMYYIDAAGFLCSSKMARGKRDKGKSDKRIEHKVSINKEKGYLYFLDKEGDISRAKMGRGGGKNATD